MFGKKKKEEPTPLTQEQQARKDYLDRYSSALRHYNVDQVVIDLEGKSKLLSTSLYCHSIKEIPYNAANGESKRRLIAESWDEENNSEVLVTIGVFDHVVRFFKYHQKD